jgi:hypothetical protein
MIYRDTYGNFIEAFGDFSKEITFLSRAVCKIDWRYSMKNILIEPSDVASEKFRGVSTDGRRLHIVDPLSCPDGLGLEAGNWRPLKTVSKYSWITQIKESKESTGQFPDYRRVISRDKPQFTFKLPGIPHRDKTGDINYMVKLFREFPEPTSINWNYINDLDYYRPWEVKWYGKDKPVIFESENYSAVIMPRAWDE